MLGISQADLAGRACLSIPTIKRAEAGAGAKVSDAARAAICVALEAAGVVFTNGHEPGVKLKRSGPQGGLSPDQLNG
jgi:hypothetical protein